MYLQDTRLHWDCIVASDSYIVRITKPFKSSQRVRKASELRSAQTHTQYTPLLQGIKNVAEVAAASTNDLQDKKKREEGKKSDAPKIYCLMMRSRTSRAELHVEWREQTAKRPRAIEREGAEAEAVAEGGSRGDQERSGEGK